MESPFRVALFAFQGVYTLLLNGDRGQGMPGYSFNSMTFEAYCRERWDMARRTRYQCIGAAMVVERVTVCAVTH